MLIHIHETLGYTFDGRYLNLSHMYSVGLLKISALFIVAFVVSVEDEVNVLRVLIAGKMDAVQRAKQYSQALKVQSANLFLLEWVTSKRFSSLYTRMM